MSIPMNTVCVQCFMNKRLEQLRSLGTDEQATEMGKRMMLLYAQSPEDMDSALLGGIVDDEICRFYGIDPDRFREEKRLSNQFAVERMDTVRSRIARAEDPVYAALQFAVLGNYLDFSALHGQVSFEKLDAMLDTAPSLELDKDIYRQLQEDLSRGKEFLYVTDNAGEIGFDRLMAETVQAAYPQLNITFLVRGGVISNDATRADAEAVGVPFPVIDSGNAIGGTALDRVSPTAKAAFDKADVILAKGMGNTESMFGCGYNIYYAFLVKCARFVQFFEKPLMTPMLVRDR